MASVLYFAVTCVDLLFTLKNCEILKIVLFSIFNCEKRQLAVFARLNAGYLKRVMATKEGINKQNMPGLAGPN